MTDPKGFSTVLAAHEIFGRIKSEMGDKYKKMGG